MLTWLSSNFKVRSTSSRSLQTKYPLSLFNKVPPLALFNKVPPLTFFATAAPTFSSIKYLLSLFTFWLIVVLFVMPKTFVSLALKVPPLSLSLALKVPPLSL